MLSYPSFNQANLQPLPAISPPDYCGPTTPSSPCESPGLGYSDFARHYFRNHCCFLFLWVLRWFTSPGSLRYPMNSDNGTPYSYDVGSPIRTSPDHRLLASPRGLSQLATSFIASMRQGIHTHALSSLTIKFTQDTVIDAAPRLAPEAAYSANPGHSSLTIEKQPGKRYMLACFKCPSDIQLSNNFLSCFSNPFNPRANP